MPDENDHKTPGQLIDALLQEKGWSKRVLAIVIGVDETNLNRMVSDKRPLTPEVALALEDVFGVPAERFLQLQRDLDLAKARLVVRADPGRATRAKLFGALPIAEMIKRGWLDADDVKDVARVESALAKFFGVATAADIAVLPHAAKKSDALTEATPAQVAWLHRAKQIASEMLVAKYSDFNGRRAIQQIRSLTLAAEEVRKVPRLLAECGIRFVLIEALPSTKMDGACFWLGEGAPVIAMSMRHDRIDNFWFVLRHELEHVLCGHGQIAPMIDADLEGERAGVGPRHRQRGARGERRRGRVLRAGEDDGQLHRSQGSVLRGARHPRLGGDAARASRPCGRAAAASDGPI